MSEHRQELESLAFFLLTAKDEEAQARKKRIEIEERIAALIPGPDKGQKTVTLPDGTKVTVDRGFNYKADTGAIKDEFEHNPAMYGMIPPLKPKSSVELDEVGYEWYREHHPNIFSIISQNVEVKPKKTSVTVKVKK